ncbi:serine hydrolase (plasmid) [Rhizobium sp. CB3171]|uniref:serine hydrolase domain-containing protein n=1 Tax=Rhizobium sp. CB3171 TaxID=3039157 RepID=UPI0024B0C126|nr:serine hydrolase [Rhizobium sp. CB3171]WFU06302.1 serine hydrolase [Rhizobium sp. CB3171]
MKHSFPDGACESIDSEQWGWRAYLLAKAQEAATEFGSISAVVVHRGKVVASAGALEEKVLIRSVRKSFLSALIGIEVERGRIRLDDTLQDLDIDDVEGLSDIERQATVRHLLQARSGVYHPALAESKEMQALGKPPRGSKAPGSHWLYNNWDFNALGTIYERATGHSVFEGVYRDIALQIGMEDFVPSDGAYLTGEQSNHPAFHMHMTSRDLARFGWLFLNHGNWNGVQVVPKEWVRESVRAHSFDGTNGYGYMWWTTGHDGEAQSTQTSIYRKHLPPFRYFAHGAFGQMIAVMPEKEVVIAHVAQSRQRTAEESVKLWEFVSLVMEAFASGE